MCFCCCQTLAAIELWGQRMTIGKRIFQKGIMVMLHHQDDIEYSRFRRAGIMQRKHLPIAIITILIVLFTTGISILTSYVSNFIAPAFKPFALPLLVIIALLVASLTAWLYFLQRGINQSTLTLSN